MSCLSEQELFCPTCQKIKKIPVCCGKTMERDNMIFFCTTCDREVTVSLCCSNEMHLRTKVLDIKKEIFGNL